MPLLFCQKLLSFHYFLRSHDNSAVDSELSEQYHTLLAEYKEQEKYLSSVQQELNQVRYNLLNIILVNFRNCCLLKALSSTLSYESLEIVFLLLHTFFSATLQFN